MSDDGNVTALVTASGTAESALRDALSLCAEIRSRGGKPDLLLYVIEDNHSFVVSKTSVENFTLAAMSIDLNRIAQSEMMKNMSDL